MAIVINTNAAALNARRTLDGTLSEMAVSMRRLSSGLRVNSARDDAAGLAIAERMSAQVRGANQAIRNANDAISLFQTADGFAGELSNSLQRIRELAVQSSNGTNTAADRKALDQEVQMHLQEMNRLASSAAFNGKNIGDGTFGTSAMQLGANAGDTVSATLSTDLRRAALGALHTLTSTDLRNVGAFAFDGTYTTVPLGNLDFSRVASPFSGGSITTAGAPATDYSGGQTAVFTVDGATVTLNANYGSVAGVGNAVQAQLNSSNSGEYVVSTPGGNLKITKTGSAASPTTAVSIAAVSGAGAAAFAGGTPATGTAAVTATRAGFSVDGHAVSITSNHSGNVGALIADIQTQLDAASPGVGAYVVGGDTNGISISRSGGLVKPTVGGFTGTGAGVFASAPATSLTLAAGDFSVQIGTGAAKDLVGSYTTAVALAAAVNAMGLNLFCAINTTTGAMEIVSSQQIVLSGAQTSGTLGFGSLSSTPSGSLANASVVDYRNAGIMSQRADAALQTVNTARANFGAMQNRMSLAVLNLRLAAENAATARGHIMDTDYAVESANLARYQVLRQAGIAMIAQANLAPQIALYLLR